MSESERRYYREERPVSVCVSVPGVRLVVICIFLESEKDVEPITAIYDVIYIKSGIRRVFKAVRNKGEDDPNIYFKDSDMVAAGWRMQDEEFDDLMVIGFDGYLTSTHDVVAGYLLREERVVMAHWNRSDDDKMLGPIIESMKVELLESRRLLLAERASYPEVK